MLHQFFSEVVETIGRGVDVGSVVVGVSNGMGGFVVPDCFFQLVNLVLLILLEG